MWVFCTLLSPAAPPPLFSTRAPLPFGPEKGNPRTDGPGGLDAGARGEGARGQLPVEDGDGLGAKEGKLGSCLAGQGRLLENQQKDPKAWATGPAQPGSAGRRPAHTPGGHCARSC
jgi:hypothetical protein